MAMAQKRIPFLFCSLRWQKAGRDRVMHQSIPAVPIPPGQPRGICLPCQSRGWGIHNFIAAWGLGISD